MEPEDTFSDFASETLESHQGVNVASKSGISAETLAYCFNKGMGWLGWVSLTSLVANGSPDSSCTMSEKGITTRLFSSILFNDFYSFRHYFNVYFSAGR